MDIIITRRLRSSIYSTGIIGSNTSTIEHGQYVKMN
jgi:hypothetical protein